MFSRPKNRLTFESEFTPSKATTSSENQEDNKVPTNQPEKRRAPPGMTRRAAAVDLPNRQTNVHGMFFLPL